MRLSSRSLWVLLLATPIVLTPAVGYTQIVPGTGTLVTMDDFEDPDLTYTHNWPKSSKEEDNQIRSPLGRSSNGRWMESPKRGAPDSIKRVETPLGGLPGSTGALYLRSRDTGIPGRPGNEQAQDDLIMSARSLSVSSSPNFTVHVYLPEWDQWEQRNGVSFGIRAGMSGPQQTTKTVRGLFRRRTETVTTQEPYYPGFFIQYIPGDDPRNTTGQPYAMVLIRANELGHEINGPVIRQTGWWTFGMSVTPDSKCHYYASPGVDPLNSRDYITSSLPYKIPGTVFNTIFFNVCSADNGQSWSTPWIIDDPKIFYGRGGTQQARR